MSHPSSSAPATLTSVLIMYDYNVYSQKIPCIFASAPLFLLLFRLENMLALSLNISIHPRLFALPGQKQPTHANTQRRGDSGHGPPDSGAGFLLARRRMRWIAADTCLSAASCVRSYPPLAFFCKPRGTLPESTKRPRPESPRRVPPLFLHPRPKHDRPQIPKHQRPADPDRTRRKSSLKDSQHTILAHRLHNAFPQRISKP